MKTQRKVDALIEKFGFQYKDYGAGITGELYAYQDLDEKRLDKLPVTRLDLGIINRRIDHHNDIIDAILEYLDVKVENQQAKVIIKKRTKSK